MTIFDPEESKRERRDYEMAYHGHGRGLVVTPRKPGQFHERPMTPAELAAREPAMKISDQIYELATYAAFAYIKSWEIIAPAIDQAVKSDRLSCLAITTTNEFFVGGVRFDPGQYDIRRVGEAPNSEPEF